MRIREKIKIKDYIIEFFIAAVSFAVFLILFLEFEWDAVITAAAVIGVDELIRNHIREGRK